MNLEKGLTGKAELDVSDEDTAIALGSGTVPVLGTPRVVALCEEAAVDAVADHMPSADHTTVGMRVQLDHLSPSAVGAHVTAEACLEKAEGRRLTFKVTAHDGHGLIAAGRITRVLVETPRFLDRLS